MTSPDDFPRDMHRFPFDASDADAVFGGSSGTDSVPEELRDLAELVEAARRAGSADELVGEDVIVAQLAAAVGEHVSSSGAGIASPPDAAHERISVLSTFRTAKLAAATTAMLVLGATAAAAATGSLPTPVQSSVAKGLSGVGISVPNDHHVALAAKHVAPRHHLGGKHRAPLFIAPPHQPKGAFGLVASVNGVSDPNTCGTSGAAGTFTLTGHKDTTFTVNVDTTTAFAEYGVTGPTFANVCVGALVAAKGTLTDTSVAATNVFIAPARHDHDGDHKHMNRGVFGLVASVNGVSDPNTCGTSGTAGTFTLTAWMGKTITVTVDTNTKFFAPGVTDPSFANVCVGAKVGAKGDITDSTVAATVAFVLPKFTFPKPDFPKPDGMHHGKHRGGVDFKGGHSQSSNGPDFSHKAKSSGFEHKPSGSDDAGSDHGTHGQDS